MSTSAPTVHHTPWRRLVPIGALIAVLVSLVVLAFLWPTVTSETRDVPIAIAGSSAQVEQVEQSLSENAEGVFDVQVVDDRDEAVRQIEEREVYGAIVLREGQAPEVLEASAGSTIVAQSLTGLATTLQQQLQAAATAQAAEAGVPAPAVSVDVTDIVPLSEDDPRGAGLAAAMFPLVMGGMIGGIVLSTAVRGASRRLVGVIVYAVAGGFAVPAILQGWFGVLQGNYFENVAAFALCLSAISATIVGAASLVGRAGVAVGPVVFMLFANPISSASSPVEFLPEPWGAIGQWFPPGAGARLVRDISYFPEVDSTLQWLILAGWTVLGLGLTAIAVVRHHAGKRRAAAMPADTSHEVEHGRHIEVHA
jgi:hypothetical protein